MDDMGSIREASDIRWVFGFGYMIELQLDKNTRFCSPSESLAWARALSMCFNEFLPGSNMCSSCKRDKHLN